MPGLVTIVFLLTYAGMALGRVPGLRVDRAGIVVLAVAALLFFGAVSPGEAVFAVDGATLLLLFALMMISAQFQNAGFYDACARAITHARIGPPALLCLVVAVSGGLSAVLANDVVVYAMTPLLLRGLQGRGYDPRPYLLAMVGASNAGSAATLIGNPQNILIGQAEGLDFWQFLLVCGPPALAALVCVHVAVAACWRRQLAARLPVVTEPGSLPLRRRPLARAIIAVLVLLALFASPLPREIGALAIAALLLLGRQQDSREVIAAVDWPLLILIAGLFIVTGAFTGTGLAAEAVAWLAGIEASPENAGVLAGLSLLASNGIGNVPAVILILQLWPDLPEGTLYGLALLTTLAGNLLLVGSLANIITAERAAACGVRLGFGDFARSGIPMTLASMALALAWLLGGGWLAW